MTTPLRDYKNITEKDCQLVTHYGEKKLEFICPADVTIGPNNQVIIVDPMNKEVIIFSKHLMLIKTFGQGSGGGKLNNPTGVATDRHVIAVSDGVDHVVKIYSLEGDHKLTFGSHGSMEGQFDHPQGLCFNRKGSLYVVDIGNYRVQVFQEENYEFQFKFGSKAQFRQPYSIAVDSSDQVYVTDYSTGGGICVFTENGHFFYRIDCDPPCSICIAPDDYIITSCVELPVVSNSHLCNVYSPNYEFVTKFGVRGREKEGQFDAIQGIAINDSGTLYVTKLHCVQIFR